MADDPLKHSICSTIYSPHQLNNIVIASMNEGKITEFKSLLSPIHCHPLSLFTQQAVAETGLSFIENAIIKARYAAKESQLPALADDSGLVIPILNGAPGVLSARFAGEKAKSSDNINLLLQRLKAFKQKERTAYFYCALAFLLSPTDPTPTIATGMWSGTISEQQKGNHGFGYDPIFYLEQYQCTAAELPLSLKNQMSHRALAFKQLLTTLEKTFNIQFQR